MIGPRGGSEEAAGGVCMRGGGGSGGGKVDAGVVCEGGASSTPLQNKAVHGGGTGGGMREASVVTEAQVDGRRLPFGVTVHGIGVRVSLP